MRIVRGSSPKLKYPKHFVDQIIWGDCFEIMRKIPKGVVDLVLCDLPYGVTACKWDSPLPLDELWEEWKRLLSVIGTVVLTATQPFTSVLVGSNREMFKYSLVWQKTRPSGFIHAKNKPLREHEDILIFSKGTTVHKGQSSRRMVYNPQGLKEFGRETYRPHRDEKLSGGTVGSRPSHKKRLFQEFTNYPKSIVKIANPNHETVHPTQKPVDLFKYLIKTYSWKGSTVLDNCIGSGTTAVAAVCSGRHFIGIEKEFDYCIAARDRIVVEKGDE